jgi:MFS family permease
MAFAIGLVAEVPSGALADKFGRDKIVRLGQLFVGFGIFVQAVGSSFMPFFVGQAIMMVGFSFISGADDALFFQKLKFDRTSINWRQLVTRGSQVALAATLIATVIGGWLHTIDPRIPWFLTGFSFLTAAWLIWPVRDERPKDTRGSFSQEIRNYLGDIKTGFKQFRLPALMPYVPLIVTLQGLFYVADYGLLRIILLDRFTFSPFWGAIAIAASGVITIGLLAILHKRADRQSEKRTLVAIGLAALASLLLALANIGLWGFVVILALYIGEYVLHPLMSDVLNKHAPERQRATVLSVASFIRMLPYVCLAPLIGYLSTHKQLDYFLIGWALCIILALFFYIRLKKHDTKIIGPKLPM